MSMTTEIAPSHILQQYIPHGLRRVHSEAMGISRNDIDTTWTSKECMQLFTQYGWKTLSLSSILEQLHGSVISSKGRDYLSYATRRNGRSDLWLVQGTVTSKLNNGLQKKVHVLSRKGGGSFLYDQLEEKPYGSRDSLGPYRSDPLGSVFQSEVTADSSNSEQMFEDGFRTRIVLSSSPLPKTVTRHARQYGTDTAGKRKNDRLAVQVGAQSYIFTMADLYDALRLANARQSTVLLRCVLADYLTHSVSDDSVPIQDERRRLMEMNIDVPQSTDFFAVYDSLKSLPHAHQGLIVLAMLRSHMAIWSTHTALFQEQNYFHGTLHPQNITIGGEITDTVSKRDAPENADYAYDSFCVHDGTYTILQEAAAVWYKLMMKRRSPFREQFLDFNTQVEEKKDIFLNKMHIYDAI